MKSFEVPIIYRSPLISAIKKRRQDEDRMKKVFSPTLLDFGSLQIYLARHFGFCYGVQYAIEIAFKTIEENEGKRIFLLSEMIHNPQVNADLKSRGVQFLQDTYGGQLIPFDEITSDDVVIIPAFGATLQIEDMLNTKGIKTEKYNTTCPFVKKVWNRGDAIAKKDYTIIIHGKPNHEETRATFSHASAAGKAVIVKDLQQAEKLAEYIACGNELDNFYNDFENQYSAGFDVKCDLQRIGVINQTTMLASDTQAIADYLKQVMIKKYNLEASDVAEHFADTRDTLCYATTDNQSAVSEMLKTTADLAIVVGGYNSSNTSHLVELCENILPTYFISDAEKLQPSNAILHYDFHIKKELLVENYLPPHRPAKVLITSGASCPDALVEGVIEKLKTLLNSPVSMDEMIGKF